MDQKNHGAISREAEKWPTVLASNVIYLIVLIPLFTMYMFSGLEEPVDIDSTQFYLFNIILEILIVGLPTFIYILFSGINARVVMRFKRIKVKELLLVAGMASAGYGLVNFINAIWTWILSYIGPPSLPQLPPVNETREYLLVLFAVGVVPAFVEEFLFRGVILRGYERFGISISVIMTGILFGFLHLNLSSIPAIVFVGIIISYVVQRADSIWAGVMYHFVNNSISVTLLFLQGILARVYEEMGEVPAGTDQVTPGILLVAAIFWGIVALISIFLFRLCFKKFKRITEGKSRIRAQMAIEEERPVIVEFLPLIGAGVVIAFFLIAEISGMLRVL